LARAQDRFAWWRRTREKQTIPAELWSLAEELGGELGASRTARALGLNSQTLSQRMSARSREASAEASFVEILPPEGPLRRSEIRIELEGGGGPKLRIELQGIATAEVAALAARLWSEVR